MDDNEQPKANESKSPDPSPGATAAALAGKASVVALGAGQTLLEELRLAGKRFVQGEFQNVKASDRERAQLMNSGTKVVAPIAQDYAAWRKSILLMASVLLVVAALFKVIGFQSFEDVLVEQQLQQVEAQAQAGGRRITEQQVREHVVGQFGRANLDTLRTYGIIELLHLLLAVVLTVLAARKWASVRSSRRMARRAWYVWMLVPVIMALIPWTGMLEFPNLGAAEALQAKKGIGLLVGMALMLSIGTKLVSVFPGAIRSSLLVKTLLPQASMPGWVAAFSAPLYVLMLVMTVAMILQIGGSALLLIGVLFLAAAPYAYLRHIRQLVRPMERDEAAALVRGARPLGYALSGIGMLLIAIFLFENDMVSWNSVFEMLLVVIGSLLLMMVVTSDFLVAAMRIGFEQSAALHTSDAGKALAQQLDDLTASGLTDLATPAEAPATGGLSGS